MTQPTPLRRNVRFQLLWIGATASMLGSQISSLAYPVLVLGITGSPAKAGLVSAALFVGMVLTAVPAGPLVDRWNRRRILIGCEAVRAAGVASVAVAVFVHQVTMGHLLVVGIVQGASAALFNPARMIAVRAVVPASQLGPALAQEEVRSHAAGLLGPPLGGALFSIARGLPFVADAVSYLASLACIVAARVPPRPPLASEPTEETASAGMMDQLAAGMHWLWTHSFVRAVCGFSLTLNVVTSGMMLPTIVLITQRSGSPAQVGIASGAMAVGGLVGAAFASRISRLLPPGRLLLAFGWWFAALLPATTLPFGPLWPGVPLALVTVAMPALTVALQGTVLTEVPDHMLGRIGSALMIASLGLAPVGPLLSGFLTQALGPSVTLAILAGLVAVIASVAATSSALRQAAPVDQPTAAEFEDASS
jgi:predicted MFS family arabinose efflux permease